MNKTVVITGGIAAATIAAVAIVHTMGAPQPNGSPAITAGAATAPMTSAGGAMKTVTTNDPALNIPAFTLAVPQDWTLHGDVLTGTGCNNGPKFVFRAQSADGLSGVSGMPRYDTFWSDDAQRRQAQAQTGCTMMAPTSAADLLMNVIVKQVRPNAQIVSAVSVVPGFDEKFAASIASANQGAQAAAAQYHMPAAHLVGDTARVKVQYDLGGHPTEEWLMVMRKTTDSTPPSFGGGTMHVMQSQTVILAEHAPVGKLDAEQSVLDAILMSEAAQPAWSQAQAQRAQQQIQQIQENGNRRIHQMQSDFATWSKNSAAQAQANIRATGQRSIANARASDAANHAMAQKTIDYSLDRQEYVNPSSGEHVKLDSGYNRAWVDGNGHAAYSNSPTADPNSATDQLRGTWTEVKAE